MLEVRQVRLPQLLADYLHGQTVDITGEEGDFYKIDYDGKTGYVISQRHE